jgi:hypothetical protein
VTSTREKGKTDRRQTRNTEPKQYSFLQDENRTVIMLGYREKKIIFTVVMVTDT